MKYKKNGVWMYNDHTSVARWLATKMMVDLQVNLDDFRMRDKIITAISDIVTDELDRQHDTQKEKTY